MPKKRSLWYVAVGALVLLTMLLAACGPTANNASSGPKSGGKIVDGLFEEPDSIFPEYSGETFANMVDVAIWAPLFYSDSHLHMNPGLATEIPTVANNGISADGLTYTIHLRPNLKWSDGSPLTSADVVFTLNLVMNPAFAARNTFDAADVASVSAPDTTTVVITLKRPVAPWLALSLVDPIEFAPVPKEIYGSMNAGDVTKSPQAFTPPVTSGPFKVSDHVKGDHITVVRNPNYYQSGRPYLDQITFKVIPDQSSLLTAVQAGQVDTAYLLDIDKLTTYKAIQGYTVYTDAPATYEALYFNETNSILKDKVVRQALTMSLKLSDIQSLWKGLAAPTCDDAPNLFSHDTALAASCYTYDPTTAASMLQQDGWVMGSDGFRHKNGKTLEIRYSTTANKAYRQSTQAVAQQQWGQIGVKVDIVNYPASTLFGTTFYDYTAYDILEFGNALGVDPDDHSWFQCNQTTDKPGGNNVSHYCNPAVDQAYAQEFASTDQNVRTQALQTVYQALKADVPVMYLYAYPDIAVARSTVHNYDPAPTGETPGIWDWYLS